ncbi:MAG: hypothetical protein K1X72_10625 [Pyrinomonadaceae bacterium]|nr:hypothetical protein [Pyrinomonadaceae bacterium]
MKKHKAIVNFLIVICVIIIFQLGCDWKKFTPNSGSQSNTNTESKKDVSDNSKSTVSGNCSNAYHPVGENIQRKYHIDYASGPVPDQDYTEKYSDFTNDGFVAKSEFEKVTSTINWRCTSDGLLATQYGNSIDMKSGGSAKIETIKSSGVTFLVESRWKQGEKWTSEYQITETITDAKGKQVGGGEGTVTQASEIVGTEEVKVPAGTFQTFKVKNQTTLNLTIKVGGMSVPSKTTIETTVWFAKDVGVVKSQNNIGSIMSATTELLSISK